MNHVTTLSVTPAAVLNKGVAGSEMQLPMLYEAARKAIEECARIDECKEWADKSAALRAYALMRDDVALTSYAQRIHLRSVRQIGLLLKQVEPQQGGDRGNAATGGRPPIAGTRTQAAEDAGLSEYQRKTALRVASVPGSEFEAATGGDGAAPPTVTHLAAQGKQPRVTESSPDSARFKSACSALHAFVQFCDANDAAETAMAFEAADIQMARECVTTLDQWLDRFVAHLSAASRA
jgi:hypothetical protein